MGHTAHDPLRGGRLRIQAKQYVTFWGTGHVHTPGPRSARNDRFRTRSRVVPDASRNDFPPRHHTVLACGAGSPKPEHNMRLIVLTATSARLFKVYLKSPQLCVPAASPPSWAPLPSSPSSPCSLSWSSSPSRSSSPFRHAHHPRHPHHPHPPRYPRHPTGRTPATRALV